MAGIADDRFYSSVWAAGSRQKIERQSELYCLRRGMDGAISFQLGLTAVEYRFGIGSPSAIAVTGILLSILEL